MFSDHQISCSLDVAIFARTLSTGNRAPECVIRIITETADRDGCRTPKCMIGIITKRAC